MRRFWQIPVLVLLLVAGPAAPGADDHDHDHDVRKNPGTSRPSQPRGGSGEEGCQANPARLADFANGERYDFASVVSFITSPACAVVHQQISRAAIGYGVSFQKNGPYRLDEYAKKVAIEPSGTASGVDRLLGKTIPETLAQNPLPSNALLPILGQLSLLSPTAARAALTTLIRQETEGADRKMSGMKPELKPAVATDLAVSLLRMGVLEPVVASDLSEAIEDMALTVQADSLARFFRGLAAAATADTTLAPTFNQSAAALNRGVQNGKEVLGAEEQSRLLRAVFEAIRASVAGSGLLEPGATELNESVATLVQGESLSLTSLQKLWKEATRILSKSSTQAALAEAVAASLTPQMVFLKSDVRDSLLAAGANYPVLGRAIQENFIRAWTKAWNQMSGGDMSVAGFNRLKATYFEPMVPRILEFPIDVVDVNWLRAAHKWGLFLDKHIEQKFPRLFLGELERRSAAMKPLQLEDSAESSMKSLAENFAVLWSLHQVHLPVLNRWVKKYEE